jgi:hypothetical protein
MQFKIDKLMATRVAIFICLGRDLGAGSCRLVINSASFSSSTL